MDQAMFTPLNSGAAHDYVKNKNDLSVNLLPSQHHRDDSEYYHHPHHLLISIPDRSPILESTGSSSIPNDDDNFDGDRAATPVLSGPVELGTKQPDRFRDLLFLILFITNGALITFWGISHGIPSLNFVLSGSSSSSSRIVLHFGGMFLILLSGLSLSILQTSLMMSLLLRYAHQLIQIALALELLLSLMMAIVFATSGYWTGVVMGAVLAMYTAWWAKTVWNRIPLAAAILQAALSSVQFNYGVVFVAYGMVFAQCIYTVIWMLAWIGLYVQSSASTCTVSGYQSPVSCESNMNAALVGFMFFSYIWTNQIFTNALHVTVSGVVGTWWFAPDLASTMWSPAIADSWYRSVTYSLGSICLGTLLVSVLHTAHTSLLWLRRSSAPCGKNISLITCVADCLLTFLWRLMSYFNKYAYIYIGLYGYDFLEAGHRVFELFQSRGWTTIIQDDLVSNVLALASWVIGLCTAGLGVFLALAHPTWMYDNGSSLGLLWAFILCLMVGTVLSRTILGVVASACSTVMVCWAESPRDLEQNHPGLHRTLMQAWQQAFPDSISRFNSVNVGAYD